MAIGLPPKAEARQEKADLNPMLLNILMMLVMSKVKDDREEDDTQRQKPLGPRVNIGWEPHVSGL